DQAVRQYEQRSATGGQPGRSAGYHAHPGQGTPQHQADGQAVQCNRQQQRAKTGSGEDEKHAAACEDGDQQIERGQAPGIPQIGQQIGQVSQQEGAQAEDEQVGRPFQQQIADQ